MSVRALLWVAQLQGVNVWERAVLVKLADHATHKGALAWPSISTIAVWAGMSERGVSKVLSALLAADLITTRDGRKGGWRKATTWQIVIPESYKQNCNNPAPDDGVNCNTPAPDDGVSATALHETTPNSATALHSTAGEPTKKERTYQELHAKHLARALDDRALGQVDDLMLDEVGIPIVMDLLDIQRRSAITIVRKLFAASRYEYRNTLYILLKANRLRPDNVRGWLLAWVGVDLPTPLPSKSKPTHTAPVARQ